MSNPTHIQWDGRNRKISKVLDFGTSFTGTAMSSKGWEPRWYMVGKEAFARSTVDGKFFPYSHRPEVAPGFVMDNA